MALLDQACHEGDGAMAAHREFHDRGAESRLDALVACGANETHGGVPELAGDPRHGGLVQESGAGNNGRLAAPEGGVAEGIVESKGEGRHRGPGLVFPLV